MAAEERSPSPGPERPIRSDEDDAWRPDWDPQRLTTGVPAGEAPGPRSRRRLSAAGVVSGAVALALVVAAAVLLIGTGADPDRPGGESAGPTSPVVSSTIAGGLGSQPDQAAIAAARRVFDQVNAEAGASPARQRTVLEQVVDPRQQADQRGCAAAGTTVRLVPAWSEVRVAADGHLVVPSLVRIFTGTRLTGTDVAIIDVTITAGQAALPALCVS